MAVDWVLAVANALSGKLPAEEGFRVLAVLGAVLGVAVWLVWGPTRAGGAVHGAKMWQAANADKRWGEQFFFKYSMVWIGFFGIIVVSQAYEQFEEWSYFIVSVVMSVPAVAAPFFLQQPKESLALPVTSRYWFKANVWIAILSYVGNYFWTHYFYKLLGATYTFKAWRLNDVPIALFLITHAYFCFYHVMTNALLRRFWSSDMYASATRFRQVCLSVAVVGLMAYVTAFMETLTIASFPYYSFENRNYAYTVGSACYGIYFIVSFPMFLRLDEDEKDRWTVSRAAIDSLAGCMLVSILLEWWRLIVGGWMPNLPSGLPFMA